MKANVSGRAITITPPKKKGGPFLVVELTISCDTCGEHSVMIAGHHLRPIVSLFQEFIEACPELTAAGEVEVVGTREYEFPFDPGEQLMPKRKSNVETIQIPHEYMAFADARVWEIVRRCCVDDNIVESVSRSCYLQGVMDGVQLMMQRPELLQELH